MHRAIFEEIFSFPSKIRLVGIVSCFKICIPLNVTVIVVSCLMISCLMIAS